jgi:hypothetical protein
MPNTALFDEIPGFADLYRIEVEICFPADDPALRLPFLVVGQRECLRQGFLYVRDAHFAPIRLNRFHGGKYDLRLPCGFLFVHIIRNQHVRCCLRIAHKKSADILVGLEVSPNTHGLTRKCPRYAQAFTIVFKSVVKLAIS